MIYGNKVIILAGEPPGAAKGERLDHLEPGNDYPPPVATGTRSEDHDADRIKRGESLAAGVPIV